MAPPESSTTPQVPRHTRTRRKLWLSHNPSYFEQANHALSLPLAYDRLIRVYQSASERQTEGNQQGWARMLEGALVRGEAKRDQAVRDRNRVSKEEEKEQMPGAGHGDGLATKSKPLKALSEEFDTTDGEDMVRNGLETTPDDETQATTKWDKPLGIVPAEELIEVTPEPSSNSDEATRDGPGPSPNTADIVVDGLGKAHAAQRWHELLRARFVAGGDEDVDYAELDRASEATDKGWQESKQQDEWFEAEMESWSDDGVGQGQKLEGETGIQDF